MQLAPCKKWIAHMAKEKMKLKFVRERTSAKGKLEKKYLDLALVKIQKSRLECTSRLGCDITRFLPNSCKTTICTAENDGNIGCNGLQRGF